MLRTEKASMPTRTTTPAAISSLPGTIRLRLVEPGDAVPAVRSGRRRCPKVRTLLARRSAFDRRLAVLSLMPDGAGVDVSWISVVAGSLSVLTDAAPARIGGIFMRLTTCA